MEKLDFMLRKPVPLNLLYNIIQQYFLKTLQVPVTEEYGDQNQIFVCVCVCVCGVDTVTCFLNMCTVNNLLNKGSFSLMTLPNSTITILVSSS